MKKIPKLTKKKLALFWSRVDVKAPEDCWEWTAGITEGYGYFKINSVYYGSHRISSFLDTGEQPDGLVCHHCDNRKCVNPRHLYVGTYQSNAQDRSDRGRQARLQGEANGGAKLTVKIVKEIRKSKLSRKELAKKYHISRQGVGDILTRESWKHI